MPISITISKRQVTDTEINMLILKAWIKSQSEFLADIEIEKFHVTENVNHSGKIKTVFLRHKNHIELDEIQLELDESEYELYKNFSSFLDEIGIMSKRDMNPVKSEYDLIKTILLRMVLKALSSANAAKHRKALESFTNALSVLKPLVVMGIKNISGIEQDSPLKTRLLDTFIIWIERIKWIKEKPAYIEKTKNNLKMFLHDLTMIEKEVSDYLYVRQRLALNKKIRPDRLGNQMSIYLNEIEKNDNIGFIKDEKPLSFQKASIKQSSTNTIGTTLKNQANESDLSKQNNTYIRSLYVALNNIILLRKILVMINELTTFEEWLPYFIKYINVNNLYDICVIVSGNPMMHAHWKDWKIR